MDYFLCLGYGLRKAYKVLILMLDIVDRWSRYHLDATENVSSQSQQLFSFNTVSFDRHNSNNNTKFI